MYYFNLQNLFLIFSEHQNFCEDINNLYLHLQYSDEHFNKLTFDSLILPIRTDFNCSDKKEQTKNLRSDFLTIRFSTKISFIFSALQ